MSKRAVFTGKIGPLFSEPSKNHGVSQRVGIVTIIHEPGLAYAAGELSTQTSRLIRARDELGGVRL